MNAISVFGVISHGLAGMLYLGVAVLMSTAWRGGRTGVFLIAACAFGSVWATVISLQIAGFMLGGRPITFLVEIASDAAWIIFLTAVASRLGVSRVVLRASHAAWLGTFVAGVVVLLGQDLFGTNIDIDDVLIPGSLLIALVGLLLIEQLHRNSAPETRWGIKALMLGVGGIFAYDLFLYSESLLLAEVNSTAWTARGAVHLLLIPLIAIAAKRSPSWDLDIFVSRQVVFYTTTLVAVGIYLLLMGLGGWLLISYGGTWGPIAQIVFAAGALLVLAILLFSRAVRARVKVFLTKHFFRNKYDYREEWLRLVSTLSEFEDRSSRKIVIKAMAQVVDSRSGVLWVLADDARQYRVAATLETDRSMPDIHASDSLVGFIKRQGWLIDLDEYRANPGHYRGLDLPEWLKAEPLSWLIVPLVLKHELMGMILLERAPGPRRLNFEDRDLLKTIGSHIAVHLAQERSDSLLSEAQQFEAYNRLTAFLMHDLNNLIAQQSLIVANADQHKRNPEFVDDAMHTIAGSVQRMRRVMDQLRRGEASQPPRPTELRFLVSAAVDRCSDTKPVPRLELNGVNGSATVDAEQCIMILVHMIKNAQEATPDDGEVTVSLAHPNGKVEISVRDTGCGMTEDFIRDRLFRPFDSTKGSQGMGIGAYQARDFARKMCGDLTVESSSPGGTTVTLALPIGKP